MRKLNFLFIINFFLKASADLKSSFPTSDLQIENVQGALLGVSTMKDSSGFLQFIVC